MGEEMSKQLRQEAYRKAFLDIRLNGDDDEQSALNVFSGADLSLAFLMGALSLSGMCFALFVFWASGKGVC